MFYEKSILHKCYKSVRFTANIIFKTFDSMSIDIIYNYYE